MRPTIFKCIPALMAGLFLAPCSSNAMEQKIIPHIMANSHISQQLEAVVLWQTPEENTLVSSLGVYQILGDLAQTCDHPTRQEIAHFTQTSFEFLSYLYFINVLPQNTAFPEKETYGQKSNNAFYNGRFILPTTGFSLDTLREEHLKSLKAEVIPTDFSNPDESAAKINTLVSTYTNKMIPSIVTPDAFKGEDPMALVLLSTLYLNNSWCNYYSECSLKFHSGSLKAKSVKAFGTRSKIPYYQTDTDVTVMLKATGDTYLMVRMNDEEGAISPINHAHIATFLANQQTQDLVRFMMPEFTIETTLDLQKLLKEALPNLLSGGKFTIDLFDPLQEVSVGGFIQKNKLDVTKDGLEGASATIMTVVAMACAQRQPEFKPITIDRPFSYTVIKMLDQDTWLPLFAGQIFNPIAPQK